MEQTYPFPADTTHFFISNTHEHDQLLNFFFHGVHYLEYFMERFNNGELYSLSSLYNLAQQLTIVVKSLTSFLGHLTSQRSPISNPRLQNLQYIRNTWLREAILNLRIYCHRYSLVVLKIVHALEQQGMNAGLEDNSLDSGNVEIIYSSGIGVDARTSTSSWWSCMGTVGEGSASLDGKYHDSAEMIWNWMGNMIVQGDLDTNTGSL
jgi:hypothetical protein